MSYDLMVFNPDAAPRNRPDFMNWYQNQTKWAEGHSYNDPIVTSGDLRNWFMEMIKTFPAMNGPYAIIDLDDDIATDYCIGKDVIYVTFAWSVAEKAYEVMKANAEKYEVGFFDASGDKGDILIPDGSGKNQPIDRPGNLSSIQEIRNAALPGQEHKSVKEILYSKLNLEPVPEENTSGNIRNKGRKPAWWQRFFRSK